MSRSYNNEDKRILVSRRNRTIYFFDEINSDSVCEAIKLFQELEAESKTKPIEFIMCSVGGDVYDGLALYDKIRQSDCNIVTIGTGLVASMAVIIFLAGDRRLLTENTRLMYHQASMGSEGKLTDVETEVKEVRILEDMTLDIVAERTGQSRKKLINDFRAVDKYLSAEKCVEEGYAHEMILNKRTRRRKQRSK